MCKYLLYKLNLLLPVPVHVYEISHIMCLSASCKHFAERLASKFGLCIL